MTPKKTIYLDYAATTPCDPRVVEAMNPYWTEIFGNVHSRTHQYGWDAEWGAEVARGQVAKLINANAKEVVFTSGATESNNMALKGVMQFYGKEKNHIVTTNIEHKCVLDSCRYLEQEGYKVTYLGVKENGLVDLDTLKEAITDKTAIVSIMYINNEIGVIQPVEEIGRICRERGVFFHCDAAQAIGKIPVDVETMNVDLMSISGHKIYGPKGIGALYVRRKPRVRVRPMIHGGGQERGMRSGTLPVPLCVGLGKACVIAKEEQQSDYAHTKELANKFYEIIESNLADIYVNGDRQQRLPGIINISFAYVEGEGLMGGIKNIAVSSGSACTSASLEPSYVLRALGVEEELAHTSLRVSIGRFTTIEEVEYAANKIVDAVNRLREMSPLWEMAQEGVDLKSIQWTGH
jgi:cysteine desulfurase